MNKEQTKQEHLAMTSAFAERCAELHLPYDERFFWYHTIDLGDGLVTPGSFDYRGHLDSYAFAPELHGRSALDLGSATGFFTFELERRGANVTSIELPSLFSWDHFPGEPPLLISGKMQRLLPNHVPQAEETLSRFFTSHSPAEQYHYLLDGPFRFCHRVLRSRAQRVYATAYDLPHALAPQRFDLVFAGDILAHLIDPLRAVAAMAEICDGTLIIAQALSTEPGGPALAYVGGDRQGDDHAEWWRPNLPWFQQVLRKLGFRSVDQVASFEGVLRPNADRYAKSIIHAQR